MVFFWIYQCRFIGVCLSVGIIGPGVDTGGHFVQVKKPNMG